jgi:hypothetical protein
MIMKFVNNYEKKPNPKKFFFFFFLAAQTSPKNFKYP